MAGFQFVHVECYSRVAGKGKAGGLSIGDVVVEAEREPSACPHVEQPEPPTLLHGVMPSEAARIAEERADGAVDAIGRKLRKDALVMLAGVASFPATMDEVKADPAKREAYEAWRSDTIAWAKTEYGAALKSVVEHTDEAHPHLHWYAVPELKDGRMSVDAIHSGRQAAAESKAQGAVKGEQNRAYKRAMREFQNRYFAAVGMRHGQTRLGPGRRRLTRAQWKAEQEQAGSLAQVQAAAADWRDGQVKKVRAQGQAHLQQAREKAQAQAATILADANAKAKEDASRIIVEARKEASGITAQARRFGGWIQATLDGMLGTRKRLEKEAKAEVEAVREEAKAKEGRLWGKIDHLRDDVKAHAAKAARVDRLEDQSKELAQARAEVERLKLKYEPKAPVPKHAPEDAPAASGFRM